MNLYQNLQYYNLINIITIEKFNIKHDHLFDHHA